MQSERPKMSRCCYSLGGRGQSLWDHSINLARAARITAEEGRVSGQWVTKWLRNSDVEQNRCEQSSHQQYLLVPGFTSSPRTNAPSLPPPFEPLSLPLPFPPPPPSKEATKSSKTFAASSSSFRFRASSCANIQEDQPKPAKRSVRDRVSASQLQSLACAELHLEAQQTRP